MTGPIPQQEPSSDLGMAASDLLYRDPHEVVHPGSTTEESPQSLDRARSSDLLFGDLEAAQHRQADELVSETEETEGGPLLQT